MGFFRDLFGPRQPCALCQLGAHEWPAAHSGSADWKLRGPEGDVTLLVCVSCRQFLIETGLLHKHPMFALSQLLSLGRARKPDPSDFLDNDSWRYIWVGLLSSAGKYSPDRAELVETIERFANQFYADVREGMRDPDTSVKEDVADPYSAAIVEASGRLEPMITVRAVGADATTVRRCALTMVTRFSSSQLSAPTTDVQMLVLGGYQEFERQWRAWQATGGDPELILRETFGDKTPESGGL